MDKDFAIKFAKDKVRQVEGLCPQLSLACSSSLMVVETPPSSIIVIHEGMSRTHGLRKDPFVTFPHEGHSYLHVPKERFHMEGFDQGTCLALW